MPIDHVLIGVADARACAAALWRRHGLRAIAGGVHPGWGTGNWIVPLGASYLELVRIVDPAVAARSDFGRRALDAIASGGGPYAWCVAPVAFDATIARLGLTVGEGSRRRPDGSVLAWRTAGLEVALADPSRPFLIDWRVAPEAHPGRSPVAHRAGAPSLMRLELSGEEEAIRAWLGADQPPIVVRPGPAALTTVVLGTTDGELALGEEDWR